MISLTAAFLRLSLLAHDFPHTDVLNRDRSLLPAAGGPGRLFLGRDPGILQNPLFGAHRIVLGISRLFKKIGTGSAHYSCGARWEPPRRRKMVIQDLTIDIDKDKVVRNKEKETR